MPLTTVALEEIEILRCEVVFNGLPAIPVTGPVEINDSVRLVAEPMPGENVISYAWFTDAPRFQDTHIADPGRFQFAGLALTWDYAGEHGGFKDIFTRSLLIEHVTPIETGSYFCVLIFADGRAARTPLLTLTVKDKV